MLELYQLVAQHSSSSCKTSLQGPNPFGSRFDLWSFGLSTQGTRATRSEIQNHDKRHKASTERTAELRAAREQHGRSDAQRVMASGHTTSPRAHFSRELVNDNVNEPPVDRGRQAAFLVPPSHPAIAATPFGSPNASRDTNRGWTENVAIASFITN